ncbi:DUF1349 domain-containing protein [archaeon]|nr:MAG: DUF1349 domain-containing protein [archaeon]
MITSFADDKFHWLNPPELWSASLEEGDSVHGYSVSENGAQLILKPPSHKDFWRKTFYTPLLVKSDAIGYMQSIPAPAKEVEMTCKVDFQYTPISQFDQAGMLIYVDDSHWMKCGIEYCDGSTRLSVVVCNGYSDWSTEIWQSKEVRLKVHTVSQSSSIVVEAASVGFNDYRFIRIAHLQSVVNEDNDPLDWQVGVFAACPGEQRGCVATFSQFSLGPREASSHNPDLDSHH